MSADGVGFVNVSFVIDRYSRFLWLVNRDHLRTDMPLDSLEMAIRRHDSDLDGLITLRRRQSGHLDRCTERLAEKGIEPSVDSVGDSYDNALAESEIELFTTGLIQRGAHDVPAERVEIATREWMDLLSHRRLHEACGYAPPKNSSSGTTKT